MSKGSKMKRGNRVTDARPNLSKGLEVARDEFVACKKEKEDGCALFFAVVISLGAVAVRTLIPVIMVMS